MLNTIPINCAGEKKNISGWVYVVTVTDRGNRLFNLFSLNFIYLLTTISQIKSHIFVCFAYADILIVNIIIHV